MNKKYKLGEKHPSSDLYRVIALRDFRDVKAGDIGGWIESESNLSHYGNAWVSGNALVYGNASVSGDAMVYSSAWITGNANVSGNAWVSGNVIVSGH